MSPGFVDVNMLILMGRMGCDVDGGPPFALVWSPIGCGCGGSTRLALDAGTWPTLGGTGDGLALASPLESDGAVPVDGTRVADPTDPLLRDAVVCDVEAGGMAPAATLVAGD